MSKPLYSSEMEAFLEFIKNNYNDYLDADYDGYDLNVDRMYSEFQDEHRETLSGMHYLEYEDE